MKKEVKRSDDLYIQFTDEEMKELNIKPNDKFSFHMQDDGSVILKKFVNVDIDISEWSREILEMLVVESVKKDLSVNDIISDIIEKFIDLEK